MSARSVGASLARGRRTRVAVGAVALLGAILVTPGCAARGTGRDLARSVDIRVQNNVIPPTSLSVSLIPSVGTRTFVGVVEPSETKTLRISPGVPAGTYRLLAETTDGSAIASRQFTLGDVGTVEWNLGMNAIRVIGVP